MTLSKRVTNMIWGRSGSRCYLNPSEELSRTRSGDIPIGEIAHIIAEERSGPRGSYDLTPEERNGVKNLLLLCPNHHTEIDNHPEVWTVHRLRSIKKRHEQWVRETLDRRILRTTDIHNCGIEIDFDEARVESAQPSQEFSVLTAPRQPPLFQLPSVVPDFTGRTTELRDLLSNVRTGSVLISALQGMGGIGKTALAIKLAHELKDNYPDGQIFLDLKGVDPDRQSAIKQNPLSPMEVMWHVIRSFYHDDPNLKRPESDAEVVAMYHSLLNRKVTGRQMRVLFLFDNARDDKQIKPLLPPPSCLMIVTSRQRFDLPGMYRQDLSRMQRNEAVKLIRVIAPRIDRKAAKIAELCGRLPLAMELVARAVNKEDSISIEEIIERLVKHHSSLRWKELQEVERSFNLSYELLDENLQRYWRMLAVFPESFDTTAAAAIWDLAVSDAKDFLVEMRSYSLLEWDNKKNRYRLHDLARDFADIHLSDSERDIIQYRHAHHYQKILSRVEGSVRTGGGIKQGLQLFDIEWTNIQAGQAWTSKHAELDDKAAQLCMIYPRDAFHTLHLRLHPRERIQWLEPGLHVAGRTGDRHSESILLGHLGVALSNLGNAHKATGYHEQALVIAHQIGDRRYEGIHLGNLGAEWAKMGDASRAVEYYERALNIAREIGDRRSEGFWLGNLGITWRELGNASRAVEYHEQALGIARELGDRRSEGIHLGNLGAAWSKLGDSLKAIDYYERGLAIARELGDKRSLGIGIDYLGAEWYKLDDTLKAVDYYEQALAIAQQIGDRRYESFHLGNLGRAHIILGQLQEAIRFYEEELAINIALEDQRGEARTLFSLGIAFSILGDEQKANNCVDKAFSISEELGDRDLKGGLLEDGAEVYLKVKKVDKAKRCLEDAFKLYCEINPARSGEVQQKLSQLFGK